MVANVQKWFTAEASSKGWAGTKFLPAAESVTTMAGCVLAAPAQKQVNVHLKVIEIATDEIQVGDPVVAEVPRKRVMRSSRPKKNDA